MTDPKTQAHSTLDDAIRAYNDATDPGTVVTAWALTIATTVRDEPDATACDYVFSNGLPVYGALGLTEMTRRYLLAEIRDGGNDT